ncbi:MAG: DinB family protein [Candidatus Thorarchaeota archaeon]
MLRDFLISALKRHLEETRPLFNLISDQELVKKPIKDGRPLGEILLHMLRSIDYYLIGLTKNEWSPLPYTLEVYSTAEEVKKLACDVFERAHDYVDELGDRDFEKPTTSFNRPAKGADILLELIEHSIHHRGQVTVYFRLLGIKGFQIPYII